MLALKDLNELLEKIPLWKRVANTPDRLDELEKRVKAIEDQISGTGEVCPYCRKPSLQLLNIKGEPGMEDLGVKKYFYKCLNCDKESNRVRTDT